MDRDAESDDQALIRACKRGEPAAWNRLMVRYRRLIYSIPLASGLSADRADDIFQTVALRLFEHLSDVRKTESLASWIAVTTRRECQAAWRKSARFAVVEDDLEQPAEHEPDLATTLHTVECEHTVALALARLGEPCRSLLSALYVEDPTPDYQEIARRLGRPIGSLGPTRARCLGKLHDVYRKLGGEIP